MSKSDKWTEDAALNFIFKNCSVLKSESGVMFVKNGTAGNGSLGAIDFLVNYRKHHIGIISEERFEDMRNAK